MKCKLLTILLLISATCTFAQNRIGIELGAGKPTFAYGTYSSVKLPIYNTNIVFTGNAYYMRKIAHHWYLGGDVKFEQYSFDYGNSTSDGNSGTYGTNVIHKSSYINVGPVIDLGVGRTREYLHAYINAGVGFLLTGDQETRNYHETFNQPTVGYDNTEQTAYKINSFIFRIGCGLKQQFPLTNKWFATINESYSFMPFGDISQPTATGGANIHPGYLSLQFGIMHKFHDAHFAQMDK